MKPLAYSLLAVLLAGTSARAQAPKSPESPVDACFAQARAEARKLVQSEADRDRARAFLETAVMRCQNPGQEPATTAFFGALNTDRARLARDLFAGRMTIEAYAAALADRRRKHDSFKDAVSHHQALAEGDADSDLVPDRLDRCPNTPYGRPTDDRGCPTAVPPRPGGREEDARLRRLLTGATVLHNPKCEGAPRPETPVPIAWGRGTQTRLGTQGFNLAIAKVAGMPPGCDLLYEIEFRFIDPNPGNPALPRSLYVTVVFRDVEDLLSDPVRAVFGLPMPLEVPISPGRTKARLAFARQYARVTWRVRAVNGGGQASPWSPAITQGPASGGVPG